MTALNESQILEKLQDLPHWTFEDGRLHRKLEFKDFKSCFAFMTLIAFEAEAQQHHPDWYNVYNRLLIQLSTHDAGGITENDFTLAHTLEKLYG